MTALIWLDETTPLPHPDTALSNGLLAAGHDLSIPRLIEAYSKGIFPWFSHGEPVLWWSPDPRMVLDCGQIKVSRSLAKKLRQIARTESTSLANVRVTTNLAFSSVMQACAATSEQRNATWISPVICQAYGQWHKAGGAHSIEVWIDQQLAGGLYGVCMGQFFFGESMFSRASNASKLALVYLVSFLQARGIQHIDCQQETGHLASLGASPINRQDFLLLLSKNLDKPTPLWGQGEILQSGQLAATIETAP